MTSCRDTIYKTSIDRTPPTPHLLSGNSLVRGPPWVENTSSVSSVQRQFPHRHHLQDSRLLVVVSTLNTTFGRRHLSYLKDPQKFNGLLEVIYDKKLVASTSPKTTSINSTLRILRRIRDSRFRRAYRGKTTVTCEGRTISGVRVCFRDLSNT